METKPDIVQQLTELLTSYNYSRESAANLMRNSNEIDPLHTETKGWAVGEGDPHKLYNKNSKTPFYDFITNTMGMDWFDIDYD